MNHKKTLNLLFTILGFGLIGGCSSTNELKTPPVLKTKSVSSQYYYCASESCPKTTKLVRDTSLPLEPEPIIITNPIVVKKEIKRHKRTHKKHKSRPRKFKQTPTPQCVLWK